MSTPGSIESVRRAGHEEGHLLESANGHDNAASYAPLNESTPVWGFYWYSWAVEVYAIVTLSLFLPITLEQYAREAAYLSSDHTMPCNGEKTVCEVHLAGVWVNTASFSLYTYSASVALQAIVVTAISRLANNTVARARLLKQFTLLGSLSCLVFLVIPAQSTAWPACAVLALSGNTAFGAAIVCLNAYLPLVAEYHTRKHGSSLQPFTNSPESTEAISTISAKGIAAGYAAGIILLSLMLIPVTLLNGSLWSFRLAIAVSGLWWLLFSIPAILWLPSSSPKPQIMPSASPSQPWVELWEILRGYHRIPQTFKFLAAWFVMSDAFATISSTAILFAKNSLGMPASSLILVGVLTPLSGIAGALGWPKMQKILLTSNITTLKLILGLTTLIPAYGLVALRTPIELFALACLFGFLYGALQSYARACFAQLIPPGEEARFFALYSITDKSSSFLGPAVVGLIADFTGSIRYGFIFILVALLLSLPILASVNMQRGHFDAVQSLTTDPDAPDG